ncbi:f-box domain containing protein [Grosmannia clavigera kw1407]|uniref:F-box domain containing protein n=1 Tax=Grosmannia clavigera (strain kw1407 / UAMH 11150) TaxID=655863 RepID=F0XB17_GROCL|nr:f-box domain containing protein [Grosmannia clavigera kw1407]EFX05125.1 f-box domain containing protein [Grosmannia clavigera kw1407]
MAPATFNVLPVELVESIISFVDLPDICSLRLASRAFNDRTSHGRFKAFCQRREILLTMPALENLVRITSHDRYGRRVACLLQDCTLTGLLEESQVKLVDRGGHLRAPPPQLVAGEDADMTARQTELLTEVFRNIKKARRNDDKNGHNGISLLSLRVAVRQEDGVLRGAESITMNFLPLWDMAQRTFRIAIDALLASNLGVSTRLDVFHSQQRCSFSSRVFVDILQDRMAETSLASLTSVFSTLQHLDISLSGPHRASGRRITSEGTATQLTVIEQQAVYFMEVLHTILDLMATGALPTIKKLDIHWFKVHPYQPDTEEEEEREGESSVTLPEPSPLPPLSSTLEKLSTTSIRLDSFALSGVKFTTADSLLQVLQALQPSHVTLYEIVLPSGAYDAVFAYLADPASPVTSYHLDDLNDVNNGKLRYMYLFGPAKPKYPGWPRPRTLTRGTDEAKTAICYEMRPTRILGSGEAMNWRAARARKFGFLTASTALAAKTLFSSSGSRVPAAQLARPFSISTEYIVARSGH